MSQHAFPQPRSCILGSSDEGRSQGSASCGHCGICSGFYADESGGFASCSSGGSWGRGGCDNSHSCSESPSRRRGLRWWHLTHSWTEISNGRHPNHRMTEQKGVMNFTIFLGYGPVERIPKSTFFLENPCHQFSVRLVVMNFTIFTLW